MNLMEFSLFTSCINCDAFDEQLCRSHWFSIRVSGLKSVKNEVNLCQTEWNKKEIKMENNKADFTLKFCCIGACPDQYVADILQTGKRQKEKKQLFNWFLLLSSICLTIFLRFPHIWHQFTCWYQSSTVIFSSLIWYIALLTHGKGLLSKAQVRRLPEQTAWRSAWSWETHNMKSVNST